MRRVQLAIIALCLAFAVGSRAQESLPVSDSPERLAVVRKYAAEYPKFDEKWTQAIAQDDPAAFIGLLKEASPRIADRERLTSRNLVDIYVEAGMSPWIAFAETDRPGTPVVPTGKLRLAIRAKFSTFMKDPQRTASILEVAVKPAFPRLIGDSSTGWMPGRSKQGSPIIEGWIDQAVWVKIPDGAEAGSVDLTVYALTEGSQDGSIVKETQKEQYKIRVVAPGKPTRENVLCLWAFGIESGEWLSRFPEKSDEEKGLHRSQLAWVEALFAEFASEEALTDLIATLRDREEYVQNVLGCLEPSE